MKVLAFPGRDRTSGPANPGLALDGGGEVVDFGRSRPEPAAQLDGAGPRHYDRVTVRAITVAIVLSLFVHFAIVFLPLVSKVDQDAKAPADEIGPLSVTVAQSRPQPPAPQPTPKSEPAQVQPTPQPQPPKPQVRPKPTPPRPQLAVKGRTPPFVVPQQTQPQPPTPQVTPAPTPVVPTTEDFSEQLAQRQAQRRAQNGGAPDEVLESDDQRATRIAKANIAAQQRSASPGQDPSEGGGIFELKRTGLNDAEFVFNGWNKDFRRKLGRSYEVRTGNNPNIQMAVVRQMIEIIREQQPGDFEWYSPRLKGRSVVMSARPKDQKELEAFLLKEFYGNDPRATMP